MKGAARGTRRQTRAKQAKAPSQTAAAAAAAAAAADAQKQQQEEEEAAEQLVSLTPRRKRSRCIFAGRQIIPREAQAYRSPILIWRSRTNTDLRMGCRMGSQNFHSPRQTFICPTIRTSVAQKHDQNSATVFRNACWDMIRDSTTRTTLYRSAKLRYY